MPIYEYVCTQCGSEIEVIQRFTDPPLETCGACSGKLQKKISASTFHLKGSGWYVTDYARKTANGGNGKVSKEAVNTESKPAESSAVKTESAKTEAAKSEPGKSEPSSSTT
jgi:putative FmdB family regulatory protein